MLARHFVLRYAKTMNPAVTGLAADACAVIDGWGWRGKLRELENWVKRAVIMADGKLVMAVDLDGKAGEASALNLRAPRELADREAIRQALTRADGNILGHRGCSGSAGRRDTIF